MVETYLASRLLCGELAASSAEVIRVTLLHWHRFAGPMPWTVDQAAAWVNDPALRANTRKSRLTKLRPYCRWLVDGGYLEDDPTAKLKSISTPVGDPRDLTFDEVAALFAVCPDDRMRLILVLMLQLGLRCGDVARIRIEDIDRRRQLLYVRAKGGRGEPTHWEPITEQAWTALSAWLKREGRYTGPLVCSQRSPGQPITGHHISKMVGRLFRDAGVKEHPFDGKSAHACRHTCAQHMLDSGAGLRDVQHALGHKTIRSTELYVRREPPGLREAMEGRWYAA
jgi:integrase/recombinase XerC